MTVPTEISSIRYQGNGTATEFDFTFPVAEAAHIHVYLWDEVEVSQVEVDAAEYTIDTPFPISASGGTLTYPLVGSPLPATKYITIARELPLVQSSFDVTNQTSFYAETFESVVDRIFMILQQHQAGLDRSIQVAEGDPNDPSELQDVLLSAAASAANSAEAAGLASAAAAASASAAASNAAALQAYTLWKVLSISQFIDLEQDDQTVAINTAIEYLLDNASTYSMLDFEGRTFLISDTIQFDYDRVASAAYLPLTLYNGKFIADTEATWTDDQPMLRFYKSGGGTAEMLRIEVERMKFQGNSLCSGILIDNNFRGVAIRRSQFVNHLIFCIKTAETLTSSGDLRIEFNNIIAPGVAAMEERTLIGIWMPDSGDAKIIGNRAQNCRTSLQGDIRSSLISLNHFFQGQVSGTPPFDTFNPVISLGPRPNDIIVGNYLDNGYIELQENLGGESPFHGYCVFGFNIHTMANPTADMNFFVFRPITTGVTLTHFKVTNSQFRVLGDDAETMLEPFRVRTFLGGNFLGAACINTDIKDNYFWGPMIPQSSHIRIRRSVTTGSPNYTFDVEGWTPFNIQPNYITSPPGLLATTNPGTVWTERSAAFEFTVHLQTAVTGYFLLEININSESQFVL